LPDQAYICFVLTTFKTFWMCDAAYSYAFMPVIYCTHQNHIRKRQSSTLNASVIEDRNEDGFPCDKSNRLLSPQGSKRGRCNMCSRIKDQKVPSRCNECHRFVWRKHSSVISHFLFLSYVYLSLLPVLKV